MARGKHVITVTETLHASWKQAFTADEILYQEKTEHQDLVIFSNPTYGRVLMLDGVIQTTEKDEFFYHEMMVHVPLFAHGAARKVLIIGGGDGGCLREALRHPDVVPTMVEIDGAVVEMSKKYLPTLSDGAFENPRTKLIITDGLKFVAETDETFDVIIVDSTDPIGPGEVLFTEDFYRNCHRCLTENGILVTQNGVPNMQPDEVTHSYRRLQGAGFEDVSFYLTAVPTYVGGFMTLGWGSKNAENRLRSLAEIKARFDQTPLDTVYYTPEVHAGSFGLPAYIQKLLK
jgi:spermidine synthase